jgi:WD40 repeat protein
MEGCLGFVEQAPSSAAAHQNESPPPNLPPQEELEDLSDRAVLPLYGHTAPVCGVDFFSDGALLLSASADATVRVWSPELRRGLAAYHGHAFPVWAVAACPHGGYFASGGADRTARIWTTEVNARPLRVLAGELRGGGVRAGRQGANPGIRRGAG